MPTAITGITNSRLKTLIEKVVDEVDEVDEQVLQHLDLARLASSSTRKPSPYEWTRDWTITRPA
jgi:hypothetical protein